MSSSTTDPAGNQAATLVDVEMPQLGVSVSEGTLVAWHKAVGDEVAYEETICDIATDKIDIECPSPAAGVVAELLVEPEQTVPVGTVLARIAVGGAASDVATAPPEPAASEVPGPQPEPPEPAPGPPHPGPPAPGPPVPEPPDPVPPPQPDPQPPVIEVPEAPFVSPVVRRIAAEHGIDPSSVRGSGRRGRVTKRDLLRALREREEAAAAAEPPLHIESPYREEPPVPSNGHGRPPARAPEAAPQPSVEAGAPQPAAPAPKTSAEPAPQPAAAIGEPLSRIRRLIGEHMRHSLDTAAHCTTIFEADMSAVERRRKEIGATYLPVVARCAIEALRVHPELNAWLEDGRITMHREVHLGIAVDLGEGGLIVPVVRDAHTLNDEGLAAAIRDLAGRARSGELRPGETDGGTFTITNPGALGAIAATPIINLPQVAILDLEAVVKRPVVIGGADGDAIAIRPMTNLCMSWDHRALDGATAARFLATLRERLERV